MNPDEYSKMYTLEDRYWWFVGRRHLALKLLRQYTSAECPLTMDIGCGTGAVLKELVKWARPVGLDMSPLALGFCRDRNLRNLILANGEKLPLTSESLDAIIGLDIFEHIPDDAAAFSECFRALNPGGTLVLSVPAFKSLWGPHDIALMHMRRYRRAEISQRLKAAGFEVQRCGYSIFFLFPVVVVFRFFEKMKRGPAQAQLVPVPDWMNRALVGLQALEAAWIGKMDLPWGSSVVAVARKPVGQSTRAG